MKNRLFAALITAAFSAYAAPRAGAAAHDGLEAPPVPREMRGVWVATVGNIDFPSRKGLGADQQKAELRAILDRAKALNLNTVIFQVRPTGDALYESKIEPWSEYLSGTQGMPPAPYYDPLAFAVDEAHQRGLELHAWFNPYRARYSRAASPMAASHLGVRRPDLVRTYGRFLWMDPGEPEVQHHSLSVILDVVRRYDVDGVHLDDYFYPYKERDANGKILPFPDDASWAKYRAAGGALARDDWRRSNIDAFMRDLYEGVKREKPWVKVGISPFGIWRPGYPKGIKGLDAYDDLYADSRKWLRNGWLDYFTPQLYWASGSPAQSYARLLEWWAGENVKKRHLWPGSILSHPAKEIAAQVEITRRQAGAGGNVFFSSNSLMNDRGGKADALAHAYGAAALVPASPWLDDTPPAGPTVRMERTSSGGETKAVRVEWEAAGAEAAALWVLQARVNSAWTTAILPAAQTSHEFTSPRALKDGDAVAVSSVDRAGNQSQPTYLTVGGEDAAATAGRAGKDR